MDAALQHETERLVKSWQHHDAARLRDYLVADVEDPRLNVQSLLTRHYLAHAVWGDRFHPLMAAELRFAAVMNWFIEVARDDNSPDTFAAIGAALAAGADNAEGRPIPAFLRRPPQPPASPGTDLAIPDYRTAAVEQFGALRLGATPPVLETFIRLWHDALAALPVDRPVSVLEPACGSANDYRCLAATGIARFLDYTGFDLCHQNIVNARALFPTARFHTGNVFAIEHPDQSCDHVIVHDLFEHLSPAGLEQAVAEVCRVARSGLCLGFFQMDETADPVIRPVDDYYVNTLSLSRTLDLFARHGFQGEALHIGSFLRWRLGCDRTHNPNAYTLILERRG